MTREYNSYLFKVGYVTYALVTYSQARAYAYIREVMRIRPENYKFLGKDTRSAKSQYESMDVGVRVADDWQPMSYWRRKWAREDESYRKGLEKAYEFWKDVPGAAHVRAEIGGVLKDTHMAQARDLGEEVVAIRKGAE